MRRKLMLGLAIAAVLSLGVTAMASALTKTTLRAGNLVVTFGGGTSPAKLPRKSYAPVTTTIFGKVKTTDGTHPSAFREAIVDIDKDVKVNPKGYPVCKPGQLTARNTQKALQVCGKSKVGQGIAHAEIAFPEQKPIEVTSPITVFNGGGNGRRAKLLIHTFITIPVPAAIVTQVTITKKGTGVHTISKIPVIAGGSGSVLDFRFKLGKVFRYKRKKVGFFEARCPDGVFKVKASKVLFKNEAKEEGVAAATNLRGGLAVPCRPKG